MERIRNLGNKGEIYTLPFSLNFSVLFYNKDLFDKFAVSYPPDSMTWDQAIELGKKMARTDGGTVYSPLYVSDFISFVGPLGQPLVDPKTEKAQLVADGISKAMGLYKRIIDLPGNSQVTKPREGFTDNQSIAMLADGGALIGVLDLHAPAGRHVDASGGHDSERFLYDWEICHVAYDHLYDDGQLLQKSIFSDGIRSGTFVAQHL
jgi:multiple sugar transport system substrate-binding protein